MYKYIGGFLHGVIIASVWFVYALMQVGVIGELRGFIALPIAFTLLTLGLWLSVIYEGWNK